MTDFEQLVYDKLNKVPRGKVTTYKLLASVVGNQNSARAVGNALNKNPHAPKVPCHRVVYSNGLLGGYAGGSAKKIALLKQEGVFVKSGRVEDFGDKLISFNN